MQRQPYLGALSIVIGLAIGYEFVAVMVARNQSPYDWTIVIPAYILGSLVGGGVLLILGRRLGYLLAAIGWGSVTALFVLFCIWPPSHDAQVGAMAMVLIGLAVLVSLFRKSSRT